MDTLTFAYYCSGHGYGHATRVSAFACHLLSLRLNRQLFIHIVSSAPKHVFSDSISSGALYRYAEIDPVIVQPLAYRVDRKKSVQVLRDFLEKKDVMLDRERRWLVETGVDCVLSDAAFLGCLAAKSAGIPSILITNFTFDSVYSYLATHLVDTPSLAPPIPSSSSDSSSSACETEPPFADVPIAESIIFPLVSQLHDGYQHADLLLRLPGCIPIPSFFTLPPLPSPQWVNPILNRFYDQVTQHLLSPHYPGVPLSLQHPKPFPGSNVVVPRLVRSAPLLVRPPSPGIYTPEGRAKFLRKTSLPDFAGMKILVVSFGGQVFKRPGGSTATSRMQSRNPSQEILALSSYPSYLSADTDLNTSPMMKQSPNKRISKENYTPLKSSTSSSHSALKSIDTNASKCSENSTIEALSKSLLSYLPQDRLSSAGGMRTSHHRSLSTRQLDDGLCQDENSDEVSSDDGSSSHLEFDRKPSGTSLPNGASTPGGTRRRHTLPSRRHHDRQFTHRRLVTHSHILIPGAPGPTAKPHNTALRSPSMVETFEIHHHDEADKTAGEEIGSAPTSRHYAPFSEETCSSPQTEVDGQSRYGSGQAFTFSSIAGADQESEEAGGEEALLPDENWIAVICGVSKEQWNAENEDGGLPVGFYVAPRDIYMPDLIAVGDVVLGKLGYGMTSECVDACTPFVYVSRPLFIEEHGLRMYLEQEGVGVELERTAYEGGQWARKVEEAHVKGLVRKREKLKKELDFHSRSVQLDRPDAIKGDDGEQRLSEREREGREMARDVVEWVDGVRKLLGRRRDMERMDTGGVRSFKDVLSQADIKRGVLVA